MDNQTLKTKIEQGLNELELKRKMFRASMFGTVKLIFILDILLVILLIVFAQSIGDMIFGVVEEGYENNNAVVGYVLASFLFFAALAGSFFTILRTTRSYNNFAKTKFVTPLMRNIFPELDYFPNNYVSENLFLNSELYTSYNHYGGDDYFKGTLNGKYVEFSELVVSRRSNNNSDNSRSSSTTIFGGLFLCVKLNNSVSSRIVIENGELNTKVNEALEKVPAFLKNFINKFIPDYGPVVETGDFEFDKLFKVYCANSEELSKVITPAVRAELIKIYNDVLKYVNVGNNRPLDLKEINSASALFKLSIKNDSLYFAVPNIRLFDIPFNRNVIENQETLVTSLTSIKMLTDLAKVI
ncbi:MAG: DUF3137 domain-containing protein [Candidatus Delongbacteria bacterium]|nr:DUF3137 domain-containing protein [Candidatus Delongbacteria bacterium]MBN2835884.1 DUF3137 domain-containing protein [Candidatus Delongbacteria bacterium]